MGSGRTIFRTLRVIIPVSRVTRTRARVNKRGISVKSFVIVRRIVIRDFPGVNVRANARRTRVLVATRGENVIQISASRVSMAIWSLTPRRIVVEM